VIGAVKQSLGHNSCDQESDNPGTTVRELTRAPIPRKEKNHFFLAGFRGFFDVFEGLPLI
jgi:hypothetical protein